MGEDTHVDKDTVCLSLIKMFPQGCRIHGTNKKNLIADVIKRCVMIHGNNYAGGKTTHDLINVQDTGKLIRDFIMDKSGQTQQVWTDNYSW